VSAEEAIAAAHKAVSLAPGLAEVYSARGFARAILQWDWNGAQVDIEKALTLDPRSDGTQRRYGILLASVGRLPEAITATLLATEIEPLDVNAWALLGMYNMAIGQFAPGHRALSHALELSPESALAILQLAANELATGKTMEAQKTNNRQPIEPWRWCMHAIIEHTLGHAQESQRVLDELIAKYGQSRPSVIDMAHTECSDPDSAFDWLERAYQQRDPVLGYIQFNSMFSGLRSDPRYKAFLRKMNFPE